MLKKFVLLAATALLNSSSALAAAGGCHDISGTYVQQFVTCAVPAIACVDATLTGDLQGVSHTVVTTFDPTTGAFTGDVTIVRDNGSTLTSTIEGSGNGVGFETITGGTRQYLGATGTIVATDTTAHFVGVYSGQICLLGDGKS
jgi:hypothetical protein